MHVLFVLVALLASAWFFLSLITIVRNATADFHASYAPRFTADADAASKSKEGFVLNQPLGMVYNKVEYSSLNNEGPTSTTTAKPIDPPSFAHQVSLQYNQGSQGWLHFCSASLIDQCTVLTTVSCLNIFKGGSSDYVLKVIAGANDLSQSEEDSRQVTTGEYMYEHPQFDKTTLNYDFAVVFLYDCFTFNDKINRVEIASSSDPPPNGTCTTSGWNTIGSVGPTNESKPKQTLKNSTLEIISKEDCDKIDKGDKKVTETMLCAKNKGNGTLEVKDLGAPLVCNKVLQGVMTYPPVGEGANKVAIFSQVYKARKWIVSIL